MTDFDNIYRVGRCGNCRSRPAYAWLASTGLRLDEARCPRCGFGLDRTSRMAHRMRELTTEEVAEQRRKGIARYEGRLVEVDEMLLGFERELRLTADERERIRCEYAITSWSGTKAFYEKALRRLRKGEAKALDEARFELAQEEAMARAEAAWDAEAGQEGASYNAHFERERERACRDYELDADERRAR